ncbi:5'-nucleotidase C-terminal domain-containing protein (plasmid) [Halarchaeum sp. CBA1220]|uniref:5'-nucleotidase C-terminal domain-containing protein n=1 Tax=Halarchaeum sp. CBA1220 TaxID=1853682 RepID=UPI000F3A922F|nr:5'-nucleotidase C-terminal domain-containing protein [Halarchaeum sp. CBA1220]QLC35168.1 5'-nucleotidase C-terminal domain-containing protein [Halarchaeum sp. CBA1220]
MSTNTSGEGSVTAVLLVLLMIGGAVPLSAATAGATSDQRVSIEAVQTPGDGTGSPYAGENVTTTGTVTAVLDDGFYIQNGTEAYSGIYVDGAADVVVRDTVTVSAPVSEDAGLTELDLTADGASVSVTGHAALPEPVAVSTNASSSEAYEGMRVTVSDLTATETPGEHGAWAVDDGSGAVGVDDVTLGADATPAAAGATIASMTGIVHDDDGAFELRPSAMASIDAPNGSDDAPNGSDDDAPTNGSDDDAPTNGSDSGEVDAPANGTTLTVVSYNDLQTAVSDPTTMGRLVGAIEERRDAHDNPTLVVGGGDEVSPSSLSPVSNWTVPVQLLNQIDPAAEVVGNHDLDYGFEPVRNYSRASEFPWLLANVRGADGGSVPGTRNYTVVERGNVTVGIVGLVDDAIKTKTAVDFAENGYTVTDFTTAGERTATMLKEEKNVDVVVATAHIGVAESEELARNTENIDLIVTGDDEVLHEPQVTSGTVIMEAGGNAEAIAEANVSVNATTARFEDGRLVTVDESVPMNETASETVTNARGTYLSTVAGVTEVPLDSTSTNYEDETAWGNFIADSFRANQHSDVALTNAGGIRGNFVIEPGDVTYDDVYTSLPFGNTLVTKELNGTELKYLLASQAGFSGQYGFESGLQVSGVQYDVNVRADGIPVTDVYVNGEPLQPNATYDVTVNSYMAGWEKLDGQPYSISLVDQPTVKNTQILYGTATVEYLESQTPIAPEDANRIRRVSLDAGTASLSASGDTVTASVSVPDSVQAVNASSFFVQNASTGVLEADDVTYDSGAGVVTARFDRAAFAELTAVSDSLQLYGKYETDAVELVAYEEAVLNADLDAAGVPASGGAAAETVALTLDGDGSDGGLDAPLGDTASVDVRATNATDGVGAYELTVSVGDGAVAEITDVEAASSAGLAEVDIGPANESAHVEVALASVDGDGPATLASVELGGVSLGGTTTLEVTPDAGPYDANGTAYDVTGIENARVTVTPGDLTGNGLAMADPDGDGRYQDVNGDGSADVVDAQALFASRDDATVHASAPAFDFNDDGRVTVGDVQALFASAPSEA